MATPIRVLRVIYDLQVGGVQRMLLRLIPHLRDAGVEVEVCCLRFEGDMAPRFRELGVPIHMVPFRSRLDPIGILRLRALINRGMFDVVHSHMYASNMAANLACRLGSRARLVNSYHSQTPWRGESQRRMIRWTARMPDRIVAISGAVREPLESLGLKARLATIHNGVEVPPVAPPSREAPSGAPVALFWAGRFVRQKRVTMLVELAAALRGAGVAFTMDLIGEGPELDRVKARAAELGVADVVRFPGLQADIRPSIQAGDLYLSASDREGLSNSLLEVCAGGRGFVVADISPNREVLADTSSGICLGDGLGAWVAAISGLAKDREAIARMGRAAHARAGDFSIRRTSALTVEMYRELLAKP